MHRALFPLPLASIEKLHFFDDPPSYPNNIFARLTFAAPLREELCRQAFALALQRHLRGSALVAEDRGRLLWVDAPHLEPEFVWQPAELDRQFHPLDLSRQPGCRVVHAETREGWTVTWQVHHALVDGLGGLQFVRDWMKYYDNLQRGVAAQEGLAELDPDKLRQLNHLGLLTRRYLGNLWRQPIALFGAGKFLFREFQTIETNPASESAGLHDSYPRFESIHLQRDEVAALRRWSVAQQVNLNSTLLASLFQATPEVLQQQGRFTDRECLRVIVPISIRTPDDQRMPAANRASLVQLDRYPREFSDGRGLAKGIDFELGLIRRWQLDKMFLIAVRANAASTHWLRSRVRKQSRRATTMLTNLGRPLLRANLPTAGRRLLMGGARLETLELIPPIRSGMPISMAVVDYAGAMTLTLQYDPRILNQTVAGEYLQQMRRRLLSEFSAS